VRLAALDFGPLKAPGPNNVKPILLQKMGKGMLLRLTTLYKASLLIGYTPTAWWRSTAVFIPKSNKADYTIPKAITHYIRANMHSKLGEAAIRPSLK
jgi:hypothetical protein